MDNMLRDSKRSSPSWVRLLHSQAARTWGEAVALSPENGHSDVASSNLCTFENCSSHLPPPGRRGQVTGMLNKMPADILGGTSVGVHGNAGRALLPPSRCMEYTQ